MHLLATTGALVLRRLQRQLILRPRYLLGAVLLVSLQEKVEAGLMEELMVQPLTDHIHSIIRYIYIVMLTVILVLLKK